MEVGTASSCDSDITEQLLAFITWLVHTHVNLSPSDEATGNSDIKTVTGRQRWRSPSAQSTVSHWAERKHSSVYLHSHVYTHTCLFSGGRAACTHINILQAMGVILGIFIFAGNAKRQPTSNLALSYFLWNLRKGRGFGGETRKKRKEEGKQQSQWGNLGRWRIEGQ